jgi:hypothetical protein
MKKIKPRYSGGKSTKFWKMVNALPDSEQNECYSLGCALQDLERRVLSAVNNAREQCKHATKVKP